MLTRSDRALRRDLVAANRTVRAARSPLPTGTNVVLRRFETRAGNPRRPGQMYQFWFRTRGCTFDRAGQCSMCNYGTGPEIDPERLLRAVRWRLVQVPQGSFVYLSPSGSLLDPREVEPGLRAGLLALVAERRPASFAFESRPELCTPAALEEVRAALPADTTVVCEIGVESWDPDVRMLCHLKPSTQESYLAAVAAARRAGMELIANITLGGLGLSPAEAHRDTVTSVSGTRRAGFITPMVFPLSAKSGTLLGWAHDRGLWDPPTLWMLVRVLFECALQGEAEGRPPDLDISWFNPAPDDVIRSRPDGCSSCRQVLLDTLVAFRLDPLSDRLSDALEWRGCDCPQRTAELLAGPIGPGHPEGSGYRDRLAAVAAEWARAGAVPDAAVKDRDQASADTRSGSALR